MHYRNDPRWITAKFASICACGRRISRGEGIYYYPLVRKAVCETCGQKGAAELAAADFDEMAYASGRGY